jgi:hypothetical protein
VKSQIDRTSRIFDELCAFLGLLLVIKAEFEREEEIINEGVMEEERFDMEEILEEILYFIAIERKAHSKRNVAKRKTVTAEGETATLERNVAIAEGSEAPANGETAFSERNAATVAVTVNINVRILTATKAWISFGMTLNCPVLHLDLQHKSPHRNVVGRFVIHLQAVVFLPSLSFHTRNSHFSGVEPPKIFPFMSKITVSMFARPSHRP